jgi:hypothetical protein
MNFKLVVSFFLFFFFFFWVVAANKKEARKTTTTTTPNRVNTRRQLGWERREPSERHVRTDGEKSPWAEEKEKKRRFGFGWNHLLPRLMTTECVCVCTAQR